MHPFSSGVAASVAMALLLGSGPVAQAQPTGFSSGTLAEAAAPITSALARAKSASNPGLAADATSTASAYGDSRKELEQALVWMQENNALHPAYWSLYAEARLRLQLKDYAGARATAEQAKKLALAASPPNQDYARRSTDLLTQTQKQAN